MASGANQLVGNRLFPDPNDPWASQAPTQADAAQYAAQAYQQWLDQQRASGVAAGLIDPQTGWPTGNALVDAARQYGNALIGGTSGPGFKVYHGSPHSFDRFDLGAIGTGEGAQAYGHGLYFADSEGVARSYRDALSQPTYGGKPYDSSDPAIRAAAYIHTFNNGDKSAALAQIDAEHAQMVSRLANLKQMYPGVTDEKILAGVGQPYQQAIENLAGTKAHIESGAPVPEVNTPGHMYEAQINADPAHFLDWDKPRDQQPPAVQAFAQANYPSAWDKAADGSSLYQHMANEAQQPIRNLVRAHNDAAQFLADWKMSGGETGGGGDRASALADIDAQLAKVASVAKGYAAKGLSIDGTQYAVRAQRLNEIRPLIADPSWSPDNPPTANAHATVSQQMAQAGIPGIRYLDGGSRADGAGTSNHVIFDPATIEILRKYGIGALIGGGAAAGAAQTEQ